MPIQAAVGKRVIARETLSAMRADVTAGLYGGEWPSRGERGATDPRLRYFLRTAHATTFRLCQFANLLQGTMSAR